MNIENTQTPLYKIKFAFPNNVYIKRDDLLPFSFGGNKARKAQYFLKDILEKKADYIVTYGSSSSNHCRVISNLSSSLNIPCIIISPNENDHETYNRKLMRLFDAEIVTCSIDDVHNMIDTVMKHLRSKGYNPYFIMGGGHGNLGTQAYVDCFDEIVKFEQNHNMKFNYIFHASGTGTTQAGLICGKLLNNSDVNIIGISIARKNPYGRNVVLKSVSDFLGDEFLAEQYEDALNFVDDYVLDGYDCHNLPILQTISEQMKINGIPLNTTYTGKAFWGMTDYMKKNKIENKNILFINTGGAPLFFDSLRFIND